MATISVAKDFTPFPGPRLKERGEWSGEEFRDEILIPALQKNEPFTLDLDGVMNYPPAFLEEAFGGLIRCGYSLPQITQLMTLKCRKPARIHEIEMYMTNEENHLQLS